MGTDALQGSDCLIGVAGHDLASGAWQPGVIPLKSYRRLATQEQEELKMGYSAELCPGWGVGETQREALWPCRPRQRCTQDLRCALSSASYVSAARPPLSCTSLAEEQPPPHAAPGLLVTFGRGRTRASQAPHPG